MLFLACPDTCATCSSDTVCNQCKPGHGKLGSSTMCIECPDGTYLNSQQKCLGY